MQNKKQDYFICKPPTALVAYMNKYMSECPALVEYLPVLQRPHPTSGLPFLAESEIDIRNAKAAAARDPTENANANVNATRVSAVVSIEESETIIGQKASTVGTLVRRDDPTDEVMFSCDLDMQRIDECLHSMLFRIY